MTSLRCARSAAVRDAAAGGRLMAAPELMAHVDSCDPCRAALARQMLDPVLRLHLDGGRSRDESAATNPRSQPAMSDYEAAILLSGFGVVDVDLTRVGASDRERLGRAAAAIDREVPNAPSVAERLGLEAVAPPAAARSATTKSAERTRTRAVVWWAAAAVVLVAAGAASLWMAWEGTPARGDADGSSDLLVRGSAVEMELALGTRRCDSAYDSLRGSSTEASPCRWNAGTETFTMNVRIEPVARKRYVVVLARDVSGDVSVLYPEPGAAVQPLAPTSGRVSDRCTDGLCWLDGGRYEVPPGRLSVVTIFAADPLPATEMAKDWAPDRWEGPGRFVERFEVEVLQ